MKNSIKTFANMLMRRSSQKEVIIPSAGLSTLKDIVVGECSKTMFVGISDGQKRRPSISTILLRPEDLKMSTRDLKNLRTYLMGIGKLRSFFGDINKELGENRSKENFASVKLSLEKGCMKISIARSDSTTGMGEITMSIE